MEGEGGQGEEKGARGVEGEKNRIFPSLLKYFHENFKMLFEQLKTIWEMVGMKNSVCSESLES